MSSLSAAPTVGIAKVRLLEMIKRWKALSAGIALFAACFQSVTETSLLFSPAPGREDEQAT